MTGVLLQPGCVLVVTGSSWTSKLIEIGAIIRGRVAASHVAVFHHVDNTGRRWGIEGRPGGVGWVDLGAYLDDRRTITNAAQPLTGAMRKTITDTMVKLLGTPYDWLGGIAADAADIQGLPVDWAENDPATGTLPGHVVCSSSAAYAYDVALAPNPGREQAGGISAGGPGLWERVTPGDWASFITTNGWAS